MDQAREGTALRLQTPQLQHCTPHLFMHEVLHSPQGKDQEGVSFWGINRLEYGLMWKPQSWKFCVITLQCVPHVTFLLNRQMFLVGPQDLCKVETFFLPSGDLQYILLCYWCKSAYGRWGLVGTIYIFHAQIFHHFNFFCNQSYPNSLQKRLELKYNVSYSDQGPFLLYRSLNFHLQNEPQIYI